MNKITNSLKERPYGVHTYKAAKLMRESMLIGSISTNSETWINISKKDLDNLEKPDIMLQRKFIADSGNPCKVFMHLEFGFLPVRYVVIERRLNFLRYI